MFGMTEVLVPDGWDDSAGGVALVIGEVGSEPLVRIQSQCTYGELFTSRLCDCRLQLVRSGEILRREGGILIHLEQEGRGAGPTIKASAYRALERRGVDSFSYYREQGIAADSRRYDMAAAFLSELGVSRVRLLTNNPSKVEGLTGLGLTVTRLDLEVKPDPLAKEYIDSKLSEGVMIPYSEG
jgi:3,4-dihydroxy 2-butanone 4-phosphate synthase/GTP cyclohydrolase II